VHITNLEKVTDPDRHPLKKGIDDVDRLVRMSPHRGGAFRGD
jgi:hypothetical protein